MGLPSTDRELVKRGGLAAFVKLAWHQVEKGTKLTWEPHMQLICDHYQAVLDGDLTRLVVNVPPGFSKSLLTNVFLLSFDWGPNRHPERKYMFLSYAEKIMYRDAKRCRDLINGTWYQERWGAGTEYNVRIDEGDRAAAMFFVNNMSGCRFATTIDGQATGQHADIQICDDPVKPADIQKGGDEARVLLEDVNFAWTNTFASRSTDQQTFRRILIMQRLHHMDLAQHCIDKGYQALILPMEFDPDRAYVSKWGSDWRTYEGELLAAGRFPQSVVDGLKTDYTPLDYESQFQQNPTASEGAIFLEDFFAQRWETPMLNTLHGWTLSVDCSNKKHNKADFFVAQVWGQWDSRRFALVDQARARISFGQGVGVIRSLREKWPQVHRVIIEDKANGTATIDTLQAEWADVVPINPKGGKDARAKSVEHLYRSNCVWHPPDHLAPWMKKYVIEHLQFPMGAHDDQVDCGTQALIDLGNKAGGRHLKEKLEKIAAKTHVGGVRSPLMSGLARRLVGLNLTPGQRATKYFGQS